MATIDKGISDIVGVFTDSIIAFPGGWGDSIPEWLKQAITLERLMMNIAALKGEEITGTDAEACVYLMTVSLTQPMDSDWTQIYLYVSTQVARRHKKVDGPADIAIDSLRDDQLRDLKRLKDWLYQQRTKTREERERGKKQQAKQEEDTRRKEERPMLFEF
jgi:hypothetical protein